MQRQARRIVIVAYGKSVDSKWLKKLLNTQRDAVFESVIVAARKPRSMGVANHHVLSSKRLPSEVEALCAASSLCRGSNFFCIVPSGSTFQNKDHFAVLAETMIEKRCNVLSFAEEHERDRYLEKAMIHKSTLQHFAHSWSEKLEHYEPPVYVELGSLFGAGEDEKKMVQ